MIRALRQLAVIVGVALLPALVSGAIQLRWNNETPVSRDEVTLSMAQKLGDHVLWVDARSRTKYDEAHIPGAILLNEDEWNSLTVGFADAWDLSEPVVVYCDGGTCDASHAIADRIRKELNVKDVYVLKGGWEAWLEK